MWKRVLPSAFLVAYSAILIKIMVFKDLPTIRIGQLMLNFAGTDAGHAPNFVPLKTILPYLFGYKGWIIAGVNLVGNIALLVPVGFLLPFAYRTVTWKKSLGIAIASGLAIEIMQTVLRVGIFDIDDVILNALGVMIGYWAIRILAQWVRERKYIHILLATIIGIAAATGAVYAIYPHGQPVVNPQGDTRESEVPQSDDLCGGTGGTGEIISKGDSTITIRRNDGVAQTLSLTEETTIRTSAGSASASDLNIGDRVTIVVYDDKTASAVLVCNIPNPETQSRQ